MTDPAKPAVLPAPSGVSAPRRRGGLADDVATYVRELILTGSLKPGTRIDQDAIGDAVGVSRSPVREAIVVLGQEGLLEILPRRGAIVAPLTRSDVIDHYELFGLISGRAAGIAATELSDQQRSELRSIHDLFAPGSGAQVHDFTPGVLPCVL